MTCIRTFQFGASVLAVCLLATCARGDVALTTLVSFDGSNGGQPWAGLTPGMDGDFYGTTDQYGAYGGGTIFRMMPDGQLTTLHFFTGGSDGAHPKASLLQGADGNFYGTATDGGDAPGTSYYGDGVIFKITPAGDFTTLAAFGGTNGSKPWAGPLVEGVDGNFYGTTAWGGVSGSPPVINGTVFQVSAAGVLNSLFTFHFTDGFSPYGGLVEGVDGSFYGVTPFGNAGTYGSIFKITTNGVLTTLATFNGTNGDNPFSALLRGTDGNFYGTTISGGASRGDPQSVNGAGFGTIFKMTPEGVLTTLFSFSRTNGAYPYATLLQDDKGYFYGTTASGGAYTNQLFGGSGYPGYGTVFRFAPDGTLSMLVSFNSTNGAQPFASLTRGADGTFYGTTIRGGAYDLGTVYSLSVPEPPSSPPAISCPDAATVECGTAAEVNVLASDSDGEALTVVWAVNGQAVQTNTVPAGQPPTVAAVSFSAELPLGTNAVMVTATDSAANTASCSTTITVVDTTPPILHHATASPGILWPANHKLVTVNINAFVNENCGPATWKITRVRSNEPVNKRGDGDAAPDWIITGDHSVKLRAERSAKGAGRIYFITIQATDESGNLSPLKILTVIVPRNPPRLAPHQFR